jgi:hypothetical protein
MKALIDLSIHTWWFATDESKWPNGIIDQSCDHAWWTIGNKILEPKQVSEVGV